MATLWPQPASAQTSAAAAAPATTAANAARNAAPASAEKLPATAEYLLGSGDIVKITVFQSPDLTLETRISESGSISYPLIGEVAIGGMAISAAERRIAQRLQDGGFLVKPQVSILLMQIRGNQVAALGYFNRPGRFPLETTQMRLSDLIAQAGGVAPLGADTVVFVRTIDGERFRRKIDIAAMFQNNEVGSDVVLQPGDIVFVDRAPTFYIYGEVQRPGNFRLERDMTVMQALATGGGLSAKGTQRGVRLHRRGADGRVKIMEPALDDVLQADDVVYVRESIF